MVAWGIGTGPETSHYILFVLNSELCEDTNFSREPDEVVDDYNPGPGEAEEGRLLSSRQSGLFRLAWVIL